MMRTDARVALPETQQTQQQTRRGYEIKCPSPAEVRTDQPTNDISQRAANWDRRVKNCHHATPCFNRKQISQDGWRRRAVAAFANSNEYACRKKDPKCRRKAGAAAGEAPQNHCRTNNDPARKSICKQTENRRANHIRDEKCVAQQTGFRRSEERRVGKECRSRWSPYH